MLKMLLGEDVNPSCEPDAKSEYEDEVNKDVVADVEHVDDTVDAQVDAGDVSEDLLDEDLHDVDLDDSPHVVQHSQSGLYLTPIATHTGMGLVDQDNEVVEVDAIQRVEDEMDVIEHPDEELLRIDFVEDLGVFQRPLTPILLQKHRDTNGMCIVMQIGSVYTTFCQEEVIVLRKYCDRNGRCIRGRLDSPERWVFDGRCCQRQGRSKGFAR